MITRYTVLPSANYNITYSKGSCKKPSGLYVAVPVLKRIYVHLPSPFIYSFNLLKLFIV